MFIIHLTRQLGKLEVVQLVENGSGGKGKAAHALINNVKSITHTCRPDAPNYIPCARHVKSV